MAWLSLRALGGVLALAGLVACSAEGPRADDSRAAPEPSAAAASQPVTGYATAVLADEPAGLWPLDDLEGRAEGSRVTALVATAGARIAEGPVRSTDGPALPGAASGAAAFTGEGRIVTRVVDEVAPGRAFTVEMFFRADDCTRAWTQVVGTASFDDRGRQGLNVLHYPRFWPSGCRLAAEFWEDDRFGGGCGTPAVVATGEWVHFALTYDGAVARCYARGKLVDSGPVTRFGTTPGTPFGIGGAGHGYGGTLDSGSIAQVAVYPRALSAAEVKAHVTASG